MTTQKYKCQYQDKNLNPIWDVNEIEANSAEEAYNLFLEMVEKKNYPVLVKSGFANSTRFDEHVERTTTIQSENQYECWYQDPNHKKSGKRAINASSPEEAYKKYLETGTILNHPVHVSFGWFKDIRFEEHVNMTCSIQIRRYTATRIVAKILRLLVIPSLVLVIIFTSIEADNNNIGNAFSIFLTGAWWTLGLAVSAEAIMMLLNFSNDFFEFVQLTKKKQE